MDLHTLKEVVDIFSKFDCSKVYFKLLQKNDNSKQQIYLGSDFSVLNIFPNLKIKPDPDKPQILKSALNFSWITDNLEVSPAESSQLIFYPQYPEVRFSGFLKGSKNSPSHILGTECREAGRVLFWGLKDNGDILGIALSSKSPLARELTLKANPDEDALIQKVTLESETNDLSFLLRDLKKVSNIGWINATRMNGDGKIIPCKGVNCGGYTLEAQLGIKNNGISEPDIYGWEIKQFNCSNLERPRGGAITLFTPEPTKGVYKDKGVNFFLKKYGYADQSGIKDRINFSSPHRFGVTNIKTGLTLALEGFDKKKNRIDDSGGGLVLLDKKGNVAAKWDYSGLMEHWNRKHNQAAYVPSINKKDGNLVSYKYGHKVFLAQKTDFTLFLKACMGSFIYYDPGIKLEVTDGRERTKRRSQFRIAFPNLEALYFSWMPKEL